MKNVMNLDEAKKIWGDWMPDEDLKKWLELKNKGATVEIDSDTGKVVPRLDY